MKICQMTERSPEDSQVQRAVPPDIQQVRTDGSLEHGGDGSRNEAGPVACSICSYKQIPPANLSPVVHRHFSSLFLRKITGVEQSGAVHLCPSCKREHLPYPEHRLSVVVSDCSLHQYFAPTGYVETLQYGGDINHIDYLTIPGARISALINAFRIEYLADPLPRNIDVLLVAGYNDLVEGYARDYIIEKIYNFADLVLQSQNQSYPGGRNTFAAATLYYPPQLAWMPDNGPFPYDGYTNNREKIDWLNQEIKRLNAANQVRFPPCFHTFGVRTCTRKRVDRYGHVSMRVSKSHRWEHWREQDPQNMLHLNTERRFKMGQALNNYFRFNVPSL